MLCAVHVRDPLNLRSLIFCGCAGTLLSHDECVLIDSTRLDTSKLVWIGLFCRSQCILLQKMLLCNVSGAFQASHGSECMHTRAKTFKSAGCRCNSYCEPMNPADLLSMMKHSRPGVCECYTLQVCKTAATLEHLTVTLRCIAGGHRVHYAGGEGPGKECTLYRLHRKQKATLRQNVSKSSFKVQGRAWDGRVAL